MASSPCLALSVTVLLLFAGAIDARNLHIVGHVTDYPLCQKVHYPKLCEAIAATGDFDSAYDLAVAAIKYTIDKLNSGAATAEGLRAGARGNKVRQGYLEVCRDHFNDAVSDLNAALDRLTGTGTAADVATQLSAGLTDADLCSSDWQESGLADFPLERVSANLYKLTSNAMILGEGLKGVKH